MIISSSNPYEGTSALVEKYFAPGIDPSRGFIEKRLTWATLALSLCAVDGMTELQLFTENSALSILNWRTEHIKYVPINAISLVAKIASHALIGSIGLFSITQGATTAHTLFPFVQMVHAKGASHSEHNRFSERLFCPLRGTFFAAIAAVSGLASMVLKNDGAFQLSLSQEQIEVDSFRRAGRSLYFGFGGLISSNHSRKLMMGLV